MSMHRIIHPASAVMEKIARTSTQKMLARLICEMAAIDDKTIERFKSMRALRKVLDDADLQIKEAERLVNASQPETPPCTTTTTTRTSMRRCS